MKYLVSFNKKFGVVGNNKAEAINKAELYFEGDNHKFNIDIIKVKARK